MTESVIIDLDGTLADLTHRLHHIKDGRRDWDGFFAAMAEDAPVPNIVRLAQTLADADNEIIICSGRPEAYRHVIVAWLDRHKIPLHAMYLREDGDYRPDQIVKKEMLESIRAKGWEPWIVVDDRQRVVDMWRANGLTVLQCAPGDFDDEKPAKAKPGQLILLVGPSGAGKSHYAETTFGSWPVVSSDSLRAQFCGDFRDQSRNAEVFHALHEIVRLRVRLGLLCVVDATNIRNADRKAVTACAPENAAIEYHVIDRPLDEKRRDAGWRAEVRVKGDRPLIDAHHDTFRQNLKDILAGDNDPRVTVVDLRKVPA